MSFTRAYKKIILTKDVPNIGFIGEICFVKPGFALNYLVPQKQALFYTDPAVKTLLTDPLELKRKQEIRNLELFLSKLKDIKIVFPRDVSEINKNVAK
jgi:large subunit ribosomal protein L9